MFESLEPRVLFAAEAPPGIALPGPSDDPLFGYATDMAGDRMIVGTAGCWQASDNHHEGNAVIFTRVGNDWQAQATLLPPEPELTERFGCEVSIHGDWAFVASTQHGVSPTWSGRVYVYHFAEGQWSHTQTLTPAVPIEGDNFGDLIQIEGSTAVLASAFHDAEGDYAASLEVYELSEGTWHYDESILMPDVGPDSGHFISLAFDGQTIVGALTTSTILGAPEFSVTSRNLVLAYQREGGAWTQAAVFEDDHLPASNRFGSGVDVDGDRIVIDTGRGQVDIHRRTEGTWQLEQSLAVPFTTWDPTSWYGYATPRQAVAISGDNLIVGHAFDSTTATHGGSAGWYRFDGNSWELTATLQADTPAENGFFGAAIDIEGDQVLIGSHYGGYTYLDGRSSKPTGAWVFDLDNVAPTLEVHGPVDGQTQTDARPSLSWSATDEDHDSLTYTLALWLGDTTDGEPALRYSGLAASSFTIPEIDTLLAGQTYTWTVTADDGHGHIVTSDAMQFTT